jgi:hypothetical protein
LPDFACILARKILQSLDLEVKYCKIRVYVVALISLICLSAWLSSDGKAVERKGRCHNADAQPVEKLLQEVERATLARSLHKRGPLS